MIYIRVELWPRGDRARARVMGEGCITNTGSGSQTVGNYTYAFSKRGGFKGDFRDPEAVRSSTLRHGVVNGFQRQNGSAWDLILLALRDGLGARVDRFLSRRR